ncbi:hypothetical protein JZ751_017174 [Albula glossodonta]|uniref:Uncharacterized protein n=1 Tax=Albula glossodonta TaxID=121402 RepID=A0A8T2NQ19_9TELE|nr:hypothetical protein JZ751_017174 [Albula glossodonta]
MLGQRSQAWEDMWIRLWCMLVCLLLAVPGGLAFLPNFWSRVLTLSWDSYTHQYMTEQAVLNVTLDTLSRLPLRRETDSPDGTPGSGHAHRLQAVATPTEPG